ncbi:GNAT family N-acetyltransferase [Flocculibacter collagenilyticus]|uniref:GNAT family N-acetyltransferase n=1 Tax=Flocculibacter collagenilyticus TaxID=2744479 RepID=UPI001F42965F|nr:GNAT family N-acetyltransferase [Flocculibacter collagenilyticus]
MSHYNEANPLVVRKAQPQDVEQILIFIKQLAEYEKMSKDVVATTEKLTTTLFSDTPFAEVIIAEYEGKPAGFALFFHTYSTFLAKPGIYLEDLYVDEAYRGKGIGKELLAQLANISIERNCGRLEWSVLDWNTPAIDFYKSLGANVLNEWLTNRLDGQNLNHVAAMCKAKIT